ncbi:hypothetical protein LTS10_007509 [Elasticomyces elasticus]|nr:hypothetical protein LTS10_007509 [Elasticomyces elasticus]
MDDFMLNKGLDSTQALNATPSRTSQQQPSGSASVAEEDDENNRDNSKFPAEVTAFGAFLSIFQGGLIAPTHTTYDSIDLLLNAPTAAERDELTKRWVDHKLEELNFVGVVGALLTGCLTSTGSWPTILSSGTETPWVVRTCWYCGIVFSLFAVLTAAQQSIRLHRLAAHRDAWRNVRLFMGVKWRDEDGVVRIKPRRFQVFGWQTSIMFLTFSVLTMVLGMCLLVWTATMTGPLRSSWSCHNVVDDYCCYDIRIPVRSGQLDHARERDNLKNYKTAAVKIKPHNALRPG